jgi:basic membrane protein A
MRRVLPAAALLAAVLSACAPVMPSGVRAGMVTDVGGLGDHSYNDAAYAGLVEARARLGIGITVLQSQSVPDFGSMLTTLANHGYDETFAVGFSMQSDLRETARRFPERHFSLIDAVIDEPNVTSLTFKEEEGSFLAGALAAMVSKTHVLGFLGGIDVPLIEKFEAGFLAGAHEIDPRVTLRVKYVGDFNDVATAAELSSIMFNERADIIYTAAGKAGLGAMQIVRGRRDDYVIGVNSDQDGIVPGKVLTSMLKRVDVAVFRQCEIAAAHQPRPARLIFGLKEDGVGLTDFRYTRRVVTPAMIARLAQIKAAIIAGTIVVPTTPDAAAAFNSDALT